MKINEVRSESSLNGSRKFFKVKDGAMHDFKKVCNKWNVDLLWDTGNGEIQVVFPSEEDIINAFTNEIERLASETDNISKDGLLNNDEELSKLKELMKAAGFKFDGVHNQWLNFVPIDWQKIPENFDEQFIDDEDTPLINALNKACDFAKGHKFSYDYEDMGSKDATFSFHPDEGLANFRESYDVVDAILNGENIRESINRGVK